jgi:hypothetical protein
MPSNAIQELIVANNITQADVNDTGYNTVGQSYTAAFKYSPADNGVYINGVAYGTPDVAVNVPSVNTCNIGSSHATGDNFNGNILKIAYYPVGLSNSTLEVITLG